MKKELLINMFMLLCCVTVTGQNIRGRIMNNNKEPLAFSNVMFVTKSDSTYLTGVVTDNNGYFTLPNNTKFSFDELLVSIRNIGYINKYLKPNADMGIIILDENVQELTEVVVKSKLPVFKMNDGILKANIQHTLLSNTGNAIQVLSLLPFMSRTTEGVSVFGRGTPLIYIDNIKIQNMDELHKLASDEIKNIELNLHPGAEYGSNVKAVIRIHTIRKGNGLSSGLTLQGSKTKHLNSMIVGKLNYRMKNWDFFGGMDMKQGRKESDVDNVISFNHNEKEIGIEQYFNNCSRNNSINANIGFSFSNNSKNDFGVKYEFTGTPYNKNNMIGSTTYTENKIKKDPEDVKLMNETKKTTHGVNAYYIGKWGKGNEININIDYLQGKTESQYITYLLQTNNVDTKNLSKYRLYTGNAKMSTPLFGGVLNYGAELSYTYNIHSYNARKDISSSLTESEDENKQTLFGVFVSQKKTFGSFSLEAGSRFEIADYKYYHLGVLKKDVSKNYCKILPYLQLDYDKDDISISLSYSNSIHRPSYGQLNSSTVYIDNYTYQRGNPFLKSAYDYVLDCTFCWKDLMMDISHTWYNNSILQTTQKMNGQTSMLFTVENIPHYHEWGVAINYSPTIKSWRPKVEMNVFKQFLTYNGREYNKPYFTYEIDNIIRISKIINFSIDIWGTANGNLYLSEFKPSFRTDIGINTYILKKKIALWIKLSDIFKTDKERWKSDINGIYFSKNRQLDTRGIVLQLRYSFNPQQNKYKGLTTNSEIIRL